MAIDSNGIYHYTAGDVVNSWPAFMNLGMSSISTKFAGVERNYTYTAGSQVAADALRIDKGSSAASPLFVFRTDTKKLMLHNGSSWSEVIPPVILDPNKIVINGTAYQRQGVINGPWATEFSGSSPVYYRILNLGSLPYTPPAGWYFHWSTGRSSGYSLISNFNTTNDQKPLHVQFMNNGTTALTSIVWELRPI